MLLNLLQDLSEVNAQITSLLFFIFTQGIRYRIFEFFYDHDQGDHNFRSYLRTIIPGTYAESKNKLPLCLSAVLLQKTSKCQMTYMYFGERLCVR